MHNQVGAEMRTKKKLRRNPRSGAYDKEEWSKAFVSQRDEFSYFIDKDSIEGKIPSDLSGSLFRNRPSLFERGAYNTDKIKLDQIDKKKNIFAEYHYLC